MIHFGVSIFWATNLHFLNSNLNDYKYLLWTSIFMHYFMEQFLNKYNYSDNLKKLWIEEKISLMKTGWDFIFALWEPT
jgi:hypothetical protein